MTIETRTPRLVVEPTLGVEPGPSLKLRLREAYQRVRPRVEIYMMTARELWLYRATFARFLFSRQNRHHLTHRRAANDNG